MLLMSFTLFVSCDSKDEEALEGTWRSAVSYDVADYIKFNGDDSYSSGYFYSYETIADEYSANETGEWEVISGEIYFTTGGSTASAPFELDGDKLTVKFGNGDISYTRQ